MPTWFILVLGSILVLAISEISQKVALTRKDDISAQANNFVVWIIQGLLALIFTLIFVSNISIDLTPLFILKLILIGSLYFFAGTLYYTSYKGQSTSISIILATCSVLVSTALGVLLFNESIDLIKIGGIIIILLAIATLNYKQGEKLSKYNLFALAGGALYGIAYTVDKSFSITINPHAYQILFCFAIAFMSFMFSGRTIIGDLKRVKISTLRFALISGISFFIYNKLNFVSYSIGGEVGRIDAINNSAVFLIIMLEFILLKDRSDLKKKILTAFMAFTGILILGFT